jgi:hypothetical protein
MMRAKYLILEQLDRDAFRATAGSNDVVITRIAERCSDTSEAHKSVRARHPNIAAMLDIGTTPEHSFLVTKLMDGCSLRMLVANPQRIALEHAVRIGID